MGRRSLFPPQQASSKPSPAHCIATTFLSFLDSTTTSISIVFVSGLRATSNSLSLIIFHNDGHREDWQHAIAAYLLFWVRFQLAKGCKPAQEELDRRTTNCLA
ncbi:unnamed protein product [Sympodiomycopsis kandeliae]